MAKFRPATEFDAIRWTGDNTRDVALWYDPTLAPNAMPEGWWVKQRPGETRLVIVTQYDDMELEIGDWIIAPAAGAKSMTWMPNEQFSKKFVAVE